MFTDPQANPNDELQADRLWRELRHSADIAMLLTKGCVMGCGWAEKEYSVAFVSKSSSPLTFAHEIGHLFGAKHNR